MIKIKYFCKLTRLFLWNNLAMFILLVISVVLWFFAGTIPDWSNERKLISHSEAGGTHFYITEKIQANRVEFELLYFNKPQPVKGDILITTEYHGGNIALWFFFGLSVLCFILGCWMTSADGEWKLEEAREGALLSVITCHLEDGKFLYLCNGKLLGSRDEQIRRENIMKEFRVRRWRDLGTLPEFQTKEQKRNSKLKRLGV